MQNHLEEHLETGRDGYLLVDYKTKQYSKKNSPQISLVFFFYLFCFVQSFFKKKSKLTVSEDS